MESGGRKSPSGIQSGAPFGGPGQSSPDAEALMYTKR